MTGIEITMDATETFATIAAYLAEHGVTRRVMFGRPTLGLEGTTFAVLDGDPLGCKLGAHSPAHDEALAIPGARLFDPSRRSRPFRAWVGIPYAAVDEWSRFTQAAMDHARSSQAS